VKAGDLVIVRDSWHSDIAPGAEGRVVKRRRRGYEVEVTGVFSNAFGGSVRETRCVFFSAKEIVRAPEPLEINAT